MLSEVDNLDSTQGWVPLFHKLNWLAREKAGTVKAAKLPVNRPLNRYRDVLPYDHSRVILQSKDGGTDYINANLVEVPKVNRRYILSQGPLPHTAGHFWQMIWENNSKAVIMLNKVVEKNQIKCFQYWPCGEAYDHIDVLEFDNFKVTYLSENRSDLFTVRTLELLNIKTGEKREVYQFHYLTWPDFGVPTSPADFLSFLFEVRNSGVLLSDCGPAVIHCSAGIGRSGTFIMVDSILAEVEDSEDLTKIDLQGRLLEIRYYRVGLIQTPDQLRFTYIAILEGTLALIPDVYQVAFDEFVDAKERALAGDEGQKDETKPEKEEEEEEEPPPLPPRRKRPDETDVKDDQVPEKKPCKSLPDLPNDEEEEGAAPAPHYSFTDAKTRAQVETVNGLSSDESGEDEIIDLSAPSSSSSSEEELIVEPGADEEDVEEETKEGSKVDIYHAREEEEEYEAEEGSRVDETQSRQQRGGDEEEEESSRKDFSQSTKQEGEDLESQPEGEAATKSEEHKPDTQDSELSVGDSRWEGDGVAGSGIQLQEPDIPDSLYDSTAAQVEPIVSMDTKSQQDIEARETELIDEEVSTVESKEDIQTETEIQLQESTEFESRPDSGIMEELHLQDITKVPSDTDSRRVTQVESRPESGISDPSSLEFRDSDEMIRSPVEEVEKTVSVEAGLELSHKRSRDSENEESDQPDVHKKSECFEKSDESNTLIEAAENKEQDESEATLRRRRWREKNEKTAELVNKIKDNVKKDERSREPYQYGPLIKKVLIFVAVCSVAYLAYRVYSHFKSIRIRPKKKRL